VIVHGPPWLYFELLKLLNFCLNADLDVNFHFDADPDTASIVKITRNHADPQCCIKLPHLRLGCPRNKQKISVCFGVSNIYRNNRNKQNCFITNRNKPKQTETYWNNPKFSEKYPNILSFKLFGSVFCLFRFNQNIETLCFSIKAKQPKQTVSKQTEKNPKKKQKPKKPKKKNRENRKNPKFSVKNSKISNCFGWSSVCSIETSKLSVSV
jgi:hypothetical protein